MIERHWKKVSLLTVLLLPLSLLNGLVQVLRRQDILSRKAFRADFRIISIGNITVGGSGKTPFTILLAKKLQAAGYRIAVSHRDYKGKLERKNCLISNRETILPAANEAGDEALLLAEKLPGIPVIAGKDRIKSLKILKCEFPDLQYAILDDSFQNLKIAHDHDFVIFNEAAGIGNGFLLPAGILREPLSALKSADTLIYNGKGKLPGYLQKHSTRVLQGKYEVTGFFLDNVTEIQPAAWGESKIILLSGIGNPVSFENSLENITWEKHYTYPDHHRFSKSDIERLNQDLKDLKADYLITTEKDHTKLRRMKISVPVIVMRIEFRLERLDLKILPLPFN